MKIISENFNLYFLYNTYEYSIFNGSWNKQGKWNKNF